MSKRIQNSIKTLVFFTISGITLLSTDNIFVEAKGTSYTFTTTTENVIHIIPGFEEAMATGTGAGTTTTTTIICDNKKNEACYSEVVLGESSTIVPGGVKSSTTTHNSTNDAICGDIRLSPAEVNELPITSIFLFTDKSTNCIYYDGDRIGIGFIDVPYYYSEVDGQTYYIHSNLVFTSYTEWLLTIQFINNNPIVPQPTEFNFSLRSLGMLEVKVEENVMIDIVDVLDGSIIVSNFFLEGTGNYQTVAMPVTADPKRNYGLLAKRSGIIVKTAVFRLDGYQIIK